MTMKIVLAAALCLLAASSVFAQNTKIATEGAGTTNYVPVLAQAQSNPVPFINQPLVPDAAAPGAEEFQLKVRGAGFVAASVVKWNDVSLATRFSLVA